MPRIGLIPWLLAACWSSPREPAAPGGEPPRQGSAPRTEMMSSTAAGSNAAGGDAAGGSAANPAGCPATTASATADVCRDRRPMTCAYPKLTCRCEAPFSGGARPDPTAPWQWVCGPAARADGCPGLSPVEREPCRGPGHDCAYDDGLVIACRSGRWTIVRLGRQYP